MFISALLCCLGPMAMGDELTLIAQQLKQPFQLSDTEKTMWMNSLLSCDARYVISSQLLKNEGRLLMADTKWKQKEWAPLLKDKYIFMEPTRIRHNFVQTDLNFPDKYIFSDYLMISGLKEIWYNRNDSFYHEWGVYFKTPLMRDYVMQELTKMRPDLVGKLEEHNVRMYNEKQFLQFNYPDTSQKSYIDSVTRPGLKYGWRCINIIPKPKNKK